MIATTSMTSECPRCANPREQRDGPFFVCTDCRWCWTISITGVVYVQSDWPRTTATDAEMVSEKMPRRLLDSIDGLRQKLDGPWPAPGLPNGDASLRRAGFAPRDIERLRRVRAATHADFFNEGLPLNRLRSEGIRLAPPGESDPHG